MTQSLNEFDWEVFNTSKSILKGRFELTVKCFFEDAEEYIKNLIDAVEDDDTEKVILNVHPLQSSSEAFGMLSLSDIAKKIEFSARTTQTDGADLDRDFIKELIPLLQEAFSNAEKIVTTQ